jgi:CubicO group peptidase (beta-lactamase class C family)
VRSLPRSTPEAQGVSSAALLGLVEALDAAASELHSLMVVRHGHVIAEGWWPPYRADRRHQLYSVSKSFTSMAVGMVVAEGKLSLDDPVTSFFPEHLPEEVGDNLAAMRVRHLLTMTTGHAEEPRTLRGRTDSWLKAFFAMPVEKEPGTHFLYNTPATYVLSAIVQKLTGTTLLEFLRERLFGPMELTEATWPSSPEGVTLGGFGLDLTTESLARFGQLLLDNGRYDNAQLVPADWITAATSKQVPNDNQDNPDWKQGYGYQFWRSRNGYRADGAFGQFCLVLPESDTVVVTTAATTDMQEVLDIMWSVLPDALAADVPLEADDAGNQRLRDRVSRLELPPPAGSGPAAADLAGRSYVVDNPERNGLERIDLGPEVTVAVGLAGDTAEVVCGNGEWRVQAVEVDDVYRAAASAVWDDGRLIVTIRFTDTPFCHTYTCTFDGDRVRVDGSVNVVIGMMPEHTRQTGRRV